MPFAHSDIVRAVICLIMALAFLINTTESLNGVHISVKTKLMAIEEELNDSAIEGIMDKITIK